MLQLALDARRHAGTSPASTARPALAEGSVQELASGVNPARCDACAPAPPGDRLAIEELSASDRAGGKLTGRGGLSVPPGGGLAYDVTLDAAHGAGDGQPAGRGGAVRQSRARRRSRPRRRQGRPHRRSRRHRDPGRRRPQRAGDAGDRDQRPDAAPAAREPRDAAPFDARLRPGARHPGPPVRARARPRFRVGGRAAARRAISRSPRSLGSIKVQARLLRPARPPVHHRARRGRLRRQQAAAADDRPRGHREDRRGRGDRRSARAGGGPEADAVERPQPAAGRDPLAPAVRHLGGPDHAGAGPAPRRRGAAAPGRRRGERRAVDACASGRARHAGRAGRRRPTRGEHRPRRQVPERQRLSSRSSGAWPRAPARRGSRSS